MYDKNFMNRNNTIMSIVPAFLIGGLIGAGIALLMAPQSGEKTRTLIKDKGIELKDKAIGTAEHTVNRAEKAVDDLASQTKERVSSLKNRGQEFVEEKRERLENEIQAAKKSASY